MINMKNDKEFFDYLDKLAESKKKTFRPMLPKETKQFMALDLYNRNIKLSKEKIKIAKDIGKENFIIITKEKNRIKKQLKKNRNESRN
tara:strand:+ start:893 stop:1156 length:264 start_codon:yes stop_codon:yes gene_type:complete